ncbi:hypothetical protein EBR96_04710 [bacterium]|nr:hypothetical protein [bacterium]
MSNHNYDGIEELDNPLPRWWVYLFYATILFGIGYMSWTWGGYGLSPIEELNRDLSAGKAQKQGQSQNVSAVLAHAASDPKILEVGKTIFTSKCAPCHAADGGGIIGPNLTDQFWIHGKGTAEDINQVVRKGVPEKGMLAWENTLKEDELIAVVAYVRSLKGTSPASPKGPEGNPSDQ